MEKDPGHQVRLGRMRMSYSCSASPKTPESRVSTDSFPLLMKTPEDVMDTCDPGHQVRLGRLRMSYSCPASSKTPE